MKNESAGFDEEQLAAFLYELVARDREVLVARLRAAAERLRSLGGCVQRSAGGDRGWSPHEIVAHIAVLAKFYGVLVYRAASARIDEVDLIEGVRERDTAGELVMQLAPEDAVHGALQDLERTISFLGDAQPASLRRSIEMRGLGSMTAEEIARISLCTHLEQHLDQLEEALR